MRNYTSRSIRPFEIVCYRFFMIKALTLYLINPVTIVTILFLIGFFSIKLKTKVKFYYFGLIIFLISSIQIFSFILSFPLVNLVKTVDKDNIRNVKSVIVLSAGIKKNIIGDWVPSLNSSDRTLLGKYYADKLSVPLVISGGVTKVEALAEAIIIKNYFNLESIVVDQNSKNTYESARNLSEYCKKLQGPFLIITGHYHRLRSFLSFRSEKCRVVFLENEQNFNYKLFIPSVHGMRHFKNLIYEYLGLTYYFLSNKIKVSVFFDI